MASITTASNDRRIHYALVKNTYDNLPTQHEGGLADLFAVIRDTRAGEHPPQKDGPGIVAARFEPQVHHRDKYKHLGPQPFRLGRCVVDVHLLMLDVDDEVAPLEAILMPWKRHALIHWSTYNHQAPGRGNNVRLVLPLARPVSKEEHTHLYQWAIDRMAAAGITCLDLACKDATRLMYLPNGGNPESSIEPWCELIEGPFLDPDALPPRGESLAEIVRCAEEARDEAAKARRARDHSSLPDSVDAVDVWDALQQISPEDYNTWQKAAAALQSEPSINGLALLERWSETTSNYKSFAHLIERKFNSFKPGHSGSSQAPASISSIFWMAKEHNPTWIHPATRRKEEREAKRDEEKRKRQRERQARQAEREKAQANTEATPEDRRAKLQVLDGGDEAQTIGGATIIDPPRNSHAGCEPPAPPDDPGDMDYWGDGDEGVSWEDTLELNKFGVPRDTIPNVTTILQNHPAWRGVLAFNRFSLNVVKRREPPWHNGEALQEGVYEHDERWTDLDTTRLRGWLRREYEFSPGKNDTHDCVEIVARQRGFHPVRDYLNALEWDGRERLAQWLVDCCGAADTDYVKAVSAWWMISAVARIFDPGCKVDHVLILEGPQGLRKSKILSSLVPTRRWFFDSVIDIGNKDAYIVIQGQWIIELAELHALSKRESNLIKAFFTSQEDTFRAPFERAARVWHRQCVFAGTVNPEGTGGYLRDATGNRRFWPVACTIDRVELVEEIRDQLWAEALHRYRAGEKWWPETREEHDMCRGEQAERYEGDTWEERVMHWLHEKWMDGVTKVTTGQILAGAIGVPYAQHDKGKSTRIGKIMTTTQADAWEKSAKIKDTVTGKRVRGYRCLLGTPPPKWDAGSD